MANSEGDGGEGELMASLGLTSFELERLKRIRRNREMMDRLGLLDNDVLVAAQQRCKGAASGADGGGAPAPARAKKEKKRKADEPLTEPSRRSRRLQDQDAEDAAGVSVEDGERPAKRGAAAFETLDGLHALAEEQTRLRNAGKQERASVVGTASYQHTLMRVRTMNEAALGRRIAAIERAKGKHAVVKMRLFARVLFLEGYEELADEAADSLKTLIAELGDPEAEGGSGGEGGEEQEEAEGGEEGGKQGKQAKKAKPERLACGAATPLDHPAVYADCLEVETLLRRLTGEGLAPGAVLERLGKEFAAAPGSGIAAGRASELRLLLKSGNVLSVRVAAGKEADGEEGGGSSGGKKKKAGSGGKKGKKAAAEAADGDGAAGGGGGVVEYDIVLP